MIFSSREREEEQYQGFEKPPENRMIGLSEKLLWAGSLIFTVGAILVFFFF